MRCWLAPALMTAFAARFRFHGAATGRWAGQGFQPQNLKRITLKKDELDAAIAAVATGDYEHVRARYERPLAIVGECSRPMICAAPGHMLIGADFSAIESRVLAWVAGEEWKLESYRRFDATQDPRDEPYCITACKIFRVPDGSFTKESPERGVGKTCDLAFGYMGGARRLAEIRAGEVHRRRGREVQDRMARGASQDRRVLARSRSRRLDRSARSRPRRAAAAASPSSAPAHSCS